MQTNSGPPLLPAACSPIHPGHKQLSNSTGSLPPGAFRTQSAENEFAFTNNALAEGHRSRLGHVIPLHIFNIAAAVANEMMVRHALCVEARSAAFRGYFPHQSHIDQIPQVVIRRGPRRARIDAIDCFENLGSGRMAVALHQERHHSVPLRSTPQPASLQRPLNLRSVHE